MLISGIKRVQLKEEKPKSAICPNCGTQGSLSITIYRKHFHLFWIPIFPFNKRGKIQCEACDTEIKKTEIPRQTLREFERLRYESQGPIWQFIGLFLIAVFIIGFKYEIEQDKKLELAHLNSPQIGDIYSYKTKKHSYSTLKVVAVSNDSLIVSPNALEVNKKSRVYKIEKAENYADSTYGISIQKIKEMYDTKEIYDIKR